MIKTIQILKKIYYVFYSKRLCKKPSILQNNISLTKKQTLVCWITSNSSSLVSLTLSGSGLATPLRTQVTQGIKLIFESPLSRSSAILREKKSLEY